MQVTWSAISPPYNEYVSESENNQKPTFSVLFLVKMFTAVIICNNNNKKIELTV